MHAGASACRSDCRRSGSGAPASALKVLVVDDNEDAADTLAIVL
jgi:hypothetical protein